MTVTATRWIDRNLSRLVLVLTVLTCASLVGWGWLQSQVRDQASEGSAARARQMQVFPVSVKVYEDAARRSVISRAELRCFKTGRGCAAPGRTP